MGWVASLGEVEASQRAVRVAVGWELVAVRYFTIDDHRSELAPYHSGPRAITDASEWESAPWSFEVGDSVDFGVELDLSSGRTISVTWELPGRHESLDVWPGRLFDAALDESSAVAIWDVSTRSRWRDFVGSRIESVDLHIIPWAPDEGFWCTRTTVSFAEGNVVLMLGDARANGTVEPSADNVAVLFSPAVLPEWERR